MATLIKGRRVVSENPPSPKDKVVRLEPADDPASISLEGVTRVEAEGLSGEEAVMAAFEINKNDLTRVSGN